MASQKIKTFSKRDEIIRLLGSITGAYSIYNVFDDWIKMLALACSQQIDCKNDREEEYKTVAKRYTKEQLMVMSQANGLLVEWADEEMTDMLGDIYMHLEISDSHLGQFFTPYHICLTMARIASNDERDIYTVNEPSCGAGGNIIAFADTLKRNGINYQERMIAVCQDLDVKAVYMCYIQLFLYGVPAVVFQSNTLLEPNGEHSSVGRMYTFGYAINPNIQKEYYKMNKVKKEGKQ